jgi:hypothetical protein
VEHGGVLLQVHAEDQRAVRAAGGRHRAQEGDRLGRMQVADRGAREEGHAPPARRAGRQRWQLERARVVGDDGHDAEPGPARAQALGSAWSCSAETSIGTYARGGAPRARERVERVEQSLDFVVSPLPYSRRTASRTQQRGELAGARVEDRELGARRVVGVEPRDRGEQRGAGGVVEQRRGQHLGRGAEAGEHHAAERRRHRQHLAPDGGSAAASCARAPPARAPSACTSHRCGTASLASRASAAR